MTAEAELDEGVQKVAQLEEYRIFAGNFNKRVVNFKQCYFDSQYPQILLKAISSIKYEHSEREIIYGELNKLAEHLLNLQSLCEEALGNAGYSPYCDKVHKGEINLHSPGVMIKRTPNIIGQEINTTLENISGLLQKYHIGADFKENVANSKPSFAIRVVNTVAPAYFKENISSYNALQNVVNVAPLEDDDLRTLNKVEGLKKKTEENTSVSNHGIFAKNNANNNPKYKKMDDLIHWAKNFLHSINIFKNNNEMSRSASDSKLIDQETRERHKEVRKKHLSI